MKILVATEGTSWESPVAEKFERAVWYAVIDTHSGEKDVFQNLPPNDNNNILLTASRMHVTLAVAGMVNATTARVLQSLNLRFAAIRRMNLRSLIRMAKDDRLRAINLDLYRQHRGTVTQARHIKDDAGTPAGKSGDAPVRTHRHLQQYGGRGH
jgi:predicted Fe-Mo cluster-binding NifX family protein